MKFQLSNIYEVIEEMNEIFNIREELTDVEYLFECNRLKLIYEYKKKYNDFRNMNVIMEAMKEIDEIKDKIRETDYIYECNVILLL